MADGTKIDSLVIEIGSKSYDVVNDINELTRALGTLKSVAKGGAGLTAINRQINKLKDALSGVSQHIVVLDKLSEIFNGVSNSATGMNATANALNSVSRAARGTAVDYSGLSDKVRSVADQFANLAPSTQKAVMAASKFNSAMSGLSGGRIVPTVAQANKALDDMTAVMRKASSSANMNEKEVRELASAYASLGAPIQKAVNANAAFAKTSRSAAKTSRQIVATTKESTGFFGKLGSNMTGLAAKFGIYYIVFKKLASAIGNWVTSSNKYIESTNLFAVSMGEFYDEAFAYAELVNDKLGIDPAQWMDAQGTFMLMAKGFGVANEQAYKLSKGLTELAYDISSLKNIKIEEAITKLRSAFAGELEPIRALGLSISQATLQEYALSKGIDEAVTSMTEQEKSLLRAVKVMEDATRIGYVGDFARTLESPANALRVLQQQITQCGRALGNVFLPILTQVIPWVQAFVSVITRAIQALATLVGFTMPKWDYSDWETDDMGFSGLEEAISGASGAAKELKGQLAGFDEITLITQTETGGGGGGGSSLSDWASQLDIPSIWDEQMLAEIESKAKALEQFIIDFANRLLLPFKNLDFAVAFSNIENFVNALQKQFEGLDFASAMWAVWDEFVGVFGAGVRLVTESILPVIEALNIPQIALKGLEFVASAFAAIKEEIRAITPLISGFVENGLVPVAEWIGRMVSGTLTWFAEQFKEIGDWFVRITPLSATLGEELGRLAGNIWAFGEPFASGIWEGALTVLSGVKDVSLSIVESVLKLGATVAETLNPAWERFQEIISPYAEYVGGVLADGFWGISVVLQYLADTVIPKVATVLENLWANVLVPIGTFVGDVLEPVFRVLGDVLTFHWQNVIMPLANFIGGTFAKAFKDISKILNETVIPAIRGITNVVSWLWEKVLSPVVDFLWDVFGPAFEEVFKAIGGVIDGVSKRIQGLMDFITGVFTWDWKQAWQGIVDIFSGIWDTLSSLIKAPINAVISIIEGLVNKIIDGWNALKEAINSLSIEIPDWLGGGTVGFNLPMSSPISIPRLAEGGMVPSGQMFIAREAGPELVGTIGGQTAVANNDQIVASIAAGVASTNSEQNELLRQQNQLLMQILEKEWSLGDPNASFGRFAQRSIERYAAVSGR